MPRIAFNEASAPKRFTCRHNCGLCVFCILLPVHGSFPVILPGFERLSTPRIPDTGPGRPRGPEEGWAESPPQAPRACARPAEITASPSAPPRTSRTLALGPSRGWTGASSLFVPISLTSCKRQVKAIYANPFFNSLRLLPFDNRQPARDRRQAF